MSEPQTAIEAVRKERVLACTPERAFTAFTDEMSSWWPLATHSSGGADAVRVTVDGRVGGEVTEHLRDGTTSVWGTITAWDPPHRLAMTWHPGNTPAEATDLEVRFEPAGSGTRLTLVHTGWERRTDGTTMRHAYDTGWDTVLAHFTDAVG